MTKAPKTPDSRAKSLAGMNKAELIKTIKALDRRQTMLLNQIAKLEAGRDAVAKVLGHDSTPPLTPVTFPWASLPNSFDTEPK